MSSPSFRYLIGGVEEPVIPGSPLWESPLPMDRHHFQSGAKNPDRHNGFTHGAYFKAARCFLEGSRVSVFSAALAPESVQDITGVHICLMKHGEFYHPARITAVGRHHQRHLVLNVAVSEPGHRIIESEVAALNRLGETPGPSFVPKVYGQGSLLADGGLRVRMFLGDWFDGYYEFHISSSESRELSVWGHGDRPFPLSREQAFLLYHQAAKILTCYYNLATTEHISQWHHAGGDFVVQCIDGRVDVRLITVRHYGPLLNVDEGAQSPEHRRDRALGGLLIFLIQLSIRMRLDRLDGIGDMTWADNTAVVATWSGFLEGLKENFFPTAILPNPVAQFKAYLAAYSLSELHDLAQTLAAALSAGPAERAMVEKHLSSHTGALLDTISRIGFS